MKPAPGLAQCWCWLCCALPCAVIIIQLCLANNITALISDSFYWLHVSENNAWARVCLSVRARDTHRCSLLHFVYARNSRHRNTTIHVETFSWKRVEYHRFRIAVLYLSKARYCRRRYLARVHRQYIVKYIMWWKIIVTAAQTRGDKKYKNNGIIIMIPQVFVYLCFFAPKKHFKNKLFCCKCSTHLLLDFIISLHDTN